MADTGERDAVRPQEAERRDTSHDEPTSDGAAADSASSPKSWPQPPLSIEVEEPSGDGVVPENMSDTLPAAALADGEPFQGCDLRVRAQVASLLGGLPTADAAEHAQHAPEAAPEASSAQADPAVAPWTKALLLERCRLMFLLGAGVIRASGGGSLIPAATKGLVVAAAEVVTTFNVKRPEVQAACGGDLDAREALLYLIGDVVLGGLVSNITARKLGDKAGKLVFGKKPKLVAQLTDAKRADQKRKMSAAAIAEAAARREREPIDLGLPSVAESTVRPPPPPRPRPQPSPLPPQDPAAAWCTRRGHRPEHIAQTICTERAKRRERADAWTPRCWQKRRRLAQLKEADLEANSLCTCCEGTCDDGTPSWLCRVARCYNLEIGTCNCSYLPGEHEDCNSMELAAPHGDPYWECPLPLKPGRWESGRNPHLLLKQSNPPGFAPGYWDIPPSPPGGWEALLPAPKPPAPPELYCACVWMIDGEPEPVGRHGKCRRCLTAIRPLGHPDLWQPAPGVGSKLDLGRALTKSPQVGADIKAVLVHPSLPKFVKQARIQLLVRSVLVS